MKKTVIFSYEIEVELDREISNCKICSSSNGCSMMKDKFIQKAKELFPNNIDPSKMKIEVK